MFYMDKHSMFYMDKHSIFYIDKFNLTQFECRIRNLTNLLVNRKKLNVFFLLLSFLISQINYATTSV